MHLEDFSSTEGQGETIRWGQEAQLRLATSPTPLQRGGRTAAIQ